MSAVTVDQLSCIAGGFAPCGRSCLPSPFALRLHLLMKLVTDDPREGPLNFKLWEFPLVQLFLMEVLLKDRTLGLKIPCFAKS